MVGSDKPSICYVTCIETGVLTLRRMLAAGANINQVMTLPPQLGEKYKVAGYEDPTSLCARYGVRVSYLTNYTLTLADLPDARFDVFIVNGWNRLIADEVYRVGRYGALGLHAGHPPIGLGRAPIVWNILLQHPDLELYAFELTERADDGDVLAAAPIEITLWDDCRTLYEKVGHVASDLFLEAIEKLTSGRAGLKQDPGALKYYKKRTPEDGLIDFFQSVDEIAAFVRAQTRPYPGAFAHLAGETWRFWRAVPYDRFSFRDRRRQPGEILAALPSGIVIATGTSPLWLMEAEAEGGTTIPASLDITEKLVGHPFEGAAMVTVRDPYERVS